MRKAMASLVGAALAIGLSMDFAQAAELQVVIVGALQNAAKALVADYGKSSGQQVKLTITNPMQLNKVLSEGSFDVVLAAAPALDDIAKAGDLQADGRTKLARVGIGVAVREGAAKPDLSTPEAFKRAIEAAPSIVYTDPTVPNASGIVIQHILTTAGLLDAVKAKGRQEGLGPGRELIAKGDVALGLFNVSEVEASGVVLAGPVPAPLQQYTNYDAAVMAKAADKAAALSFIKFVTSKDAAARWNASGLEAAAAGAVREKAY